MNRDLFGHDEAVRESIERDLEGIVSRYDRTPDLPLRRNAHPETSHEAARRIVPKLADLHVWIRGLIADWPGSTANELAEKVVERDPRRIGRRLPELEGLGAIRRGASRPCQITGRMAATWYPKGDA